MSADTVKMSNNANAPARLFGLADDSLSILIFSVLFAQSALGLNCGFGIKRGGMLLRHVAVVLRGGVV